MLLTRISALVYEERLLQCLQVVLSSTEQRAPGYSLCVYGSSIVRFSVL